MFSPSAVNVRLSETLKRADEYKALSLANEEALQEVNRVSAEFQQSMQEKFDAAVAAEEKTKEKLADVEKRREKLTQEYDQLQKNMHEQVGTILVIEIQRCDVFLGLHLKNNFFFRL